MSEINDLAIAFYNRFSITNDFNTGINGQLFENMATEDAVYPYAVYSISSGKPEYTFTEDLIDVKLSLSIYSDDMDSSVIKTLYRKASVWFDECALTITTSVLIWLREMDILSRVIDHITKSGVKKVREYLLQFDLYASLK